MNFSAIFSEILPFLPELFPKLANAFLTQSFKLPGGATISAYATNGQPQKLSLGGIVLALEEYGGKVPAQVQTGNTIIVVTPPGQPIVSPSISISVNP